jgi:hypothetical protein
MKGVPAFRALPESAHRSRPPVGRLRRRNGLCDENTHGSRPDKEDGELFPVARASQARDRAGLWAGLWAGLEEE